MPPPAHTRAHARTHAHTHRHKHTHTHTHTHTHKANERNLAGRKQVLNMSGNKVGDAGIGALRKTNEAQTDLNKRSAD